MKKYTKKVALTIVIVIFVVPAVLLAPGFFRDYSAHRSRVVSDSEAKVIAHKAASEYCKKAQDSAADCSSIRLVKFDEPFIAPTDGYNTYNGSIVTYHSAPYADKKPKIFAVGMNTYGRVQYVTDSGYLQYPNCPVELKLPGGQCKGLPTIKFSYQE